MHSCSSSTRAQLTPARALRTPGRATRGCHVVAHAGACWLSPMMRRHPTHSAQRRYVGRLQTLRTAPVTGRVDTRLHTYRMATRATWIHLAIGLGEVCILWSPNCEARQVHVHHGLSERSRVRAVS
jgi:hypothetical protein